MNTYLILSIGLVFIVVILSIMLLNQNKHNKQTCGCPFASKHHNCPRRHNCPFALHDGFYIFKKNYNK